MCDYDVVLKSITHVVFDKGRWRKNQRIFNTVPAKKIKGTGEKTRGYSMLSL